MYNAYNGFCVPQVETAKWLEHHFGSESTRSSTGNLSEEEEEKEEEKSSRGHQKTTSNSFINVTMKSTETPPSPANGYFKGVSEWKNKDTPAPIRPPIRRKKEQKVEVVNNAVNELESSPLFNSVQQRVHGYEMTKEKLSGRNAINGYNNQSHHNGYVQVRYSLALIICRVEEIDDSFKCTTQLLSTVFRFYNTL